jgi:hypothetical protein
MKEWLLVLTSTNGQQGVRVRLRSAPRRGARASEPGENGGGRRFRLRNLRGAAFWVWVWFRCA